MLVIPSKYVNELRALSNKVAHPTAAIAHIFMGRYTKINIILKSDLHFRTLQLKLTPNLNNLLGPMQEELEFALNEEIPKCSGAPLGPALKVALTRVEDWVPIKPCFSILRLVARVSARIFLGLPLCRNPEWLEISTGFTTTGR